MNSVEFRIPISPTQSFYDQIELFCFSLNKLGGLYRAAKVILFVGGDVNIQNVRAANLWSRNLNVEWYAVPDDIFAEYSFYGTANWRFEGPEPTSDLIILADADTILVKEFDENLLNCDLGRPVVLGFQAHYPPGENAEIIPSPFSPEYWAGILDAVGVSRSAIRHRYSMDLEGNFPLAPPYFNYGFVAFNRSAFNNVQVRISEAHKAVLVKTNSFMQCQIALTIAILKSDTDYVHLPARYNYINDNIFIEHFQDEISKIINIHYLRLNTIDRSKIRTQPVVSSQEANIVDSMVLEMISQWQQHTLE